MTNPAGFAAALDAELNASRRAKSNAASGLATDGRPKDLPVRVDEVDGSAEVTSKTYTDSDFVSEADLLSDHGFDPELWRVDGRVRSSRWMQRTADGEEHWLSAKRFTAVRITEDDEGFLDLPSLWAEAERTSRSLPDRGTAARTLVVALADIQVGKSDHRGGTPELVERLAVTLAKLDQHLAERSPEAIVLADVGDLIEGFESGGSPLFTNDLSHPKQLELASTVIARFVRLCAEHAPTTVVAVPSNHARWRAGKQSLGRPGDDYGIAIHRQVENLLGPMIDAVWVYPESEFDECVVHDVYGLGLGVVHGNQWSPNGQFRWWQGQQHGGQPAGRADILLSGHYHHLVLHPDGRNAATGKQKVWLQAPTLDNGSSWFRGVRGSDSDPGLLTFEVSPEGFELTSLAVL